MSQYEMISRLIKRKCGATPFELMQASGSTCIHKRLSELKARGWNIRREQVKGCTYGRYFGTAPKD